MVPCPTSFLVQFCQHVTELDLIDSNQGLVPSQTRFPTKSMSSADIYRWLPLVSLGNALVVGTWTGESRCLREEWNWQFWNVGLQVPTGKRRRPPKRPSRRRPRRARRGRCARVSSGRPTPAPKRTRSTSSSPSIPTSRQAPLSSSENEPYNASVVFQKPSKGFVIDPKQDLEHQYWNTTQKAIDTIRYRLGHAIKIWNTSVEIRLQEPLFGYDLYKIWNTFFWNTTPRATKTICYRRGCDLTKIWNALLLILQIWELSKVFDIALDTSLPSPGTRWFGYFLDKIWNAIILKCDSKRHQLSSFISVFFFDESHFDRPHQDVIAIRKRFQRPLRLIWWIVFTGTWPEDHCFFIWRAGLVQTAVAAAGDAVATHRLDVVVGRRRRAGAGRVYAHRPRRRRWR